MHNNPKFQHRHYAAIAACVVSAKGHDQNALVEELITMFKRDNSRFDGQRFLNAIGGVPTKKDARAMRYSI